MPPSTFSSASCACFTHLCLSLLKKYGIPCVNVANMLPLCSTPCLKEYSTTHACSTTSPPPKKLSPAYADCATPKAFRQKSPCIFIFAQRNHLLLSVASSPSWPTSAKLAIPPPKWMAH